MLFISFLIGLAQVEARRLHWVSPPFLEDHLENHFFAFRQKVAHQTYHTDRLKS